MPSNSLKRLHFGQVALAQALLLFAREREERRAASVAEIPHARPLEQVACAVCLMALQPVHQAPRAAGEPGAARRARERMDVIADFRPRRKRDALDAHEVGHAIQVRLRLRAQFVVDGDQHILAAEQVEPGPEMRCETIAAGEIRARLQDLVERTPRPREMNDQLVGRNRMIDGIAQSRNDTAVWNVDLDAVRRIRMKKDGQISTILRCPVA